MGEPDRPVNLGRVRRALARLDALAAARGDLFDPTAAGRADLDALTLTLEESMPQDSRVAFRLPADILERVDRYADKLARENPGMRVSRSDAVRMLLTRALDQVLPEEG